MAAKTKPVKTLASFRAQHDRNVTVPAKFKATLEALERAEGPEAWEYEAEFAKRGSISQTDLGQYRSQFEAHIVETRSKGGSTKRVWFVNPAHAKKMREAIS
jgi:hypothetical protein